MSTAGKVLSVLSVLLMLVWIFLISGVAQLNSEHGKKVSELQKKADELRDQTTKAQDEALDTREAVVREQEAKDRELRNARIELSAVERQLTSTRERLSRLQFQLETYAKALTTSKENLDLRNKEKADLETAKANGTALVDKLRSENAERLDQLGKLRDEFQQTRQRNVSTIDSVRGGRPQAQPVSLPR
jgi:chromosome segregation ATPase